MAIVLMTFVWACMRAAQLRVGDVQTVAAA
jgi:hypothetical protein